ncbi:MAG: hypothetical protein AAB632_00895 [Patescibacteria group bacterium]
MISKQLLNYIEREDKLGKSKNEVEDILISAGWHKDAISDALDSYYKKDGEKESEVQTPSEVDVSTESIEKETKTEKDANVRNKKKNVRPVFLIILSFVLGAAIMMAISIFFLNNPAKDTSSIVQNVGGFEAQKVDDGKRVVEVLEIQKSLEKYYDEYKSYPENISLLKDAPTASSELNYAYTPIGSPSQSYTLNIEMKNTDNGEFKIDGGFMTLKNKQGTK